MPCISRMAPDSGAPMMPVPAAAIMNKRDGARAVRRREELGQVVDDAGKEARLGRAEQEAQDVERRLALHEREAGADDGPGDHDARDPAARADLGQDQIRGHLEQEVADEEDARAQGVNGGRHPQLLRHLLLGEADVHAVEERGHEAEAQEGNHLPGDLAHQLRFVSGHGSFRHGVTGGSVLSGSAHGARRERHLPVSRGADPDRASIARSKHFRARFVANAAENQRPPGRAFLLTKLQRPGH